MNLTSPDRNSLRIQIAIDLSIDPRLAEQIANGVRVVAKGVVILAGLLVAGSAEIG